MSAESDSADNSDEINILKSVVAAYQMGTKIEKTSPLCKVLFPCKEDEIESEGKGKVRFSVSTHKVNI
jgi:hypothetical protein